MAQRPNQKFKKSEQVFGLVLPEMKNLSFFFLQKDRKIRKMEFLGFFFSFNFFFFN